MKHFIKAFGLILAAAFITSCGEKNLYDKETAQKIEEQEVKKSYTDYFKATYPNVDLNQNWDFTTGQVTYSLSSGDASTRALTRADGYNLETGSIVVEKAVSDYIFQNLSDQTNNKQKGNPFYMKVPDNPFTISPIFQGRASYIWELWMWVEGIGDIKIWTKAQDLSYRTSADGDWKKTGLGLEDGVKNAYEVKAPTYTFSGLPAGKEMYFYLKVTNNNNCICSSLGQMMLTIDDCPVPANVPAGNEVMIVGCEDRPNYDCDYEDVVFMVYGNPVPPVKVLKERIVTKAKRYMMEDLGSLDDFDFNDVVVDVAERTKEILEYKVDANGNEVFTGKITKETLPTLATIRAMGGTLDFTLKIGNTEWTKSSLFDIGTMYNTKNPIDFNAVLDEFEVTGWNYSQNNVSVTVLGQNGGVRTIGFAKAGEAPMIIAFDTTQEWMTERQSIPETWFTTPASAE